MRPLVILTALATLAVLVLPFEQESGLVGVALIVMLATLLAYTRPVRD